VHARRRRVDGQPSCYSSRGELRRVSRRAITTRRLREHRRPGRQVEADARSDEGVVGQALRRGPRRHCRKARKAQPNGAGKVRLGAARRRKRSGAAPSRHRRADALPRVWLQAVENARRRAWTPSGKGVTQMRHLLRSILVLALLVSVTAGCTSMTGKSAGTNVDDATITATVKEKLAVEQISTLTKVDVNTNRGTVYLTGNVKTADMKAKATEVARQVAGVHEVVNNLKVE